MFIVYAVGSIPYARCVLGAVLSVEFKKKKQKTAMDEALKARTWVGVIVSPAWCLTAA